MIPSDGATSMDKTESDSAMPTDVTNAMDATGSDSNIPTDVTTALHATVPSWQSIVTTEATTPINARSPRVYSMIPSDGATAMDATESDSSMPADDTKALDTTGSDSNIPTDVTTALHATVPSWPSIVRTEATTPINAPSPRGSSMIPPDGATAMDATEPQPWSRFSIPKKSSLVCGITEDFSSYWLSYGFPFRYASEYPDHLCTHYIFSAMVFDEYNDTDFKMYPNSFERLDLFIEMRKESNATFIVSIDALEVERRVTKPKFLKPFAENVANFLRFYDFDGFDIYKVCLTRANVPFWSSVLSWEVRVDRIPEPRVGGATGGGPARGSGYTLRLAAFPRSAHHFRRFQATCPP
ncbi:hypothetical protein ISCGN_005295 [Ixodes scapularis]